MAKKKAETKVVKKNNVVKAKHLDQIWDVVDEIQKNLDTLNDRVARVMNRMGLE